ncbi:MAG: DUF1015 domain-containing protein [Planctomycetota bacterium]|jgi:uncharacterized protein (DUF1015 family)
MLRTKPFAALRPPAHLAARVASLPYDVVTTEEARQIAAENADSFMHVVRSEADLPTDVSPYDDRVYAAARRNLDGMVERGLLQRDDRPSMYLYRQVLNHGPQMGIVCCCHVDDYARDVIKRHEKTRPDKEDDRTRHVLATDANTGPVFLTFRDEPHLARLMAEDANDRPVFHFNATDGVTHTGWEVKHPEAYVEAFAALPCAYVADGHHRTASAARAGAERAGANPGHDGSEEYNWFMVALFPASDLTILPYNRVVADLNGHTPEQVLGALAEVGTLRDTGQRAPARPGVFCLYLDGRWHELELDPASIDRDDPIASLDVDLLQSRVLAPVLGVGDPRSDARLDFVGGIRGPEALERRVDSGESGVAFSLFATSIEQLLSVADAGLIMPPKSTWFEPKLRSGLFVHTLD